MVFEAIFEALLLYPPEADSPGCFVLSVCEPSTLRVSGKPTDVGCACRANYLGYRDNETVADGEELERIASLGCWHRYVAVDLDRHGHVAFDPVRCCGPLDVAFEFCRQWHGLIEFDFCCGHKVWLIENDSQLLT